MRLYSRYVARMPEERAPTVKRLLEKEVSQAESLVDANATKILLMDGSRALWNYAKSTPCFEGYEFLIDYYHACEHLSAAAEALFGKETEQSKVWYRRWKGKLYEEEGAAQALIRSIDYYTDNNRLSPSRKKEVRNQRTFFLNGKDRMNYAEFIERGLPIGSGPVEAACKTIVKQRMCRSGQRWTRNGGQHIMNIRTIVQSNRWDSFWNACEQIRLAA